MTHDDLALWVAGVSKRYGRRLALEGCTFELPRGRIAALVGPNGAGKSTLLRLAAGLDRPSAGTIEVFGRPAGEQAEEALGRVAYLDQTRPLYATWKVGDLLRFAERMNARFARELVERRLDELGIGTDRRVKGLSVGQQAQVALALCLGKGADLLLLDEPAAALDPLARRQLMTMLLEEAADRDVTVLLSSHAVADLEEVCDYLVVLSRSRVQLAGAIEDVLATHLVLTGPPSCELPEDLLVLHRADSVRQSTWVVRTTRLVESPFFEVARPSLGEVVLAYLEADGHLAPASGASPGTFLNDGVEVAS